MRASGMASDTEAAASAAQVAAARGRAIPHCRRNERGGTPDFDRRRATAPPVCRGRRRIWIPVQAESGESPRARAPCWAPQDPSVIAGSELREKCTPPAWGSPLRGPRARPLPAPESGLEIVVLERARHPLDLRATDSVRGGRGAPSSDGRSDLLGYGPSLGELRDSKRRCDGEAPSRGTRSCPTRRSRARARVA